jgi:hypothetical protein
MVRYLHELRILKIPYTSLILLEQPKPVQAPAAVVLDEVTNGYVPKSTSSMNLGLLHIILIYPFFELGVNILHYQ